MKEGRWLGGGRIQPVTQAPHLYTSKQLQVTTQTYPYSCPALLELCAHKDTSIGLQAYVQRTGNYTQVPCSLHRAPTGTPPRTHVQADTQAHTPALSHTAQTSEDLHKDRPTPTVHRPTPLPFHLWHQAQALPHPRWQSGPMPRGGWHCGEQAGQGGEMVWQGEAPPGRPWRAVEESGAVGGSGAQAWHSTGWHG